MPIPFLGELSALLTACFWSVSSLAFASATARAGSVNVNITRLIVAAVVLSALILLVQIDVNLSQRQVAYLCFSGFLGLALGDSFLFKAYQHLGARITMLIMSLSPAIAAGLAYFVLDEGISTVGVIGIAITVTGISIVVLDRSTPGSGDGGSHLTAIGLLLAFLAAVGQGSGLVFAKVALRESPINGFVATSVRILASLLVLLPAALLTGRYRTPVKTFSEDRKAFALTLLGALFGPILGITGSLIAVEHTKIGIAATIMAIVPILMLPLVRVIYKEHLHWRAIVGAIVAVAGVAVLFLR